jgi:hypothetical protein
MKIVKRGKPGEKAKVIESFQNWTWHEVETKAGKLKLKVTSLDVGFQSMLGRELPTPSPPMMPLKVEGNRTKRDHRGGAQMVPNPNDPEYLKDKEEISHLQGVAAVYYSLEDDENVKWDTKREDFIVPGKGIFKAKEFYSAISKEFEKAKFQLGAFGGISDAAFEISGFPQERLEEMRSFFYQKRAGL